MVQNLKGFNAALLLKARKYRHKVRFSYSEQYLTGNLLEIGAGAIPVRHFAKAVTYLDYTSKEIIAEHFNVELDKVFVDIVGSMADIPTPDGSFDSITTSHVLEHLEDPAKGLKECFRALRDQGTLFLVVPNAKTSEFDFNKQIFSAKHFIEEHNDPELLAQNKLVH